MTPFQPSMTEWFAEIGQADEAKAFREEDNHKADRLEALFQIAGVPYERPIAYEAVDAFFPSEEFRAHLDAQADRLCAIRLVPKKSELPKLRQRGLPFRQTYVEWLLKQSISPGDYRVYVCPHSDVLKWSATFVVHPNFICGEIIRGMHWQLTQGETKEVAIQFSYDFETWKWSIEDEEAKQRLMSMLDYLRITDQAKQQVLKEALQASFSHDYLEGYFEATIWPDDQIYLIDYNRRLGRSMEAPFIPSTDVEMAKDTLKGSTAFPGVAQGRVVVVDMDTMETVDFAEGDILVTRNTDVRYLPLMQRCGAIVTDLGGILSHAAIIARELKKPCIVGAKQATTLFKTGDRIRVDAQQGVMRRLL